MLRADRTGRSSRQSSRHKLRGKAQGRSSEQRLRAKAQGRSSRQKRRTRAQGRSSGQKSRQKLRAEAQGRSSRQKLTADAQSRCSWQKLMAEAQSKVYNYKASRTTSRATVKDRARRQNVERQKQCYLEHHLELCREGEESTEHCSHGHEHELKEQQASQVVHACHCVGLPCLQPEQPCNHAKHHQ